MPETIVHLPDGKLLHVPEGADVLASVRQYGDQQAAGAQHKAEDESSFLHQLGNGVKEFGHSFINPSTTEKAPITFGSAKADPMGELARFFSPDNLGGLSRDAAIMAATAKAPELMNRAMPSPSTIGQGIEGASRAVPQKILGTDVPLRQMVESAGKSLQTPERNVAGFDRYAPNKGAAPVDREALTSRVPYAASESEGGSATGGPVDSRSPWELSTSDIGKLKSQGFTDEQIWRGRKPADALSQITQSLKPTPAPTASAPADGMPDFLKAELHSGFNNGHVLPEGMTPTERLAQASSSLETPHTGDSIFDADHGGFVPRAQVGSDPTYTDWAKGMDDVINAAGEEDMPSAAGSGLARSRPTNAIKDWMSKLQQTNGRGWPFKEIQP